MKPLKAPIIFTGSKARELPHIEKVKPKIFNKVVDVFGGGGSVSIHFVQSMEVPVHYNDINPDLFSLFSSLKDEKKIEHILEEITKIPVSQPVFFDVYDKKYVCDPVTRYIYLRAHTYRNEIDSKKMNLKKVDDVFVPSRTNVKYDKLLKYPKILGSDRFVVTIKTTRKF